MLALEQLRMRVKTQQVQISAFMSSHMQLQEEVGALRECLMQSGALAPEGFHASLHRRQFAEVIRRHPGPWPGSLDDIMHNQELALAIAGHAGAASIIPLATSCHKLRGSIRSLVSKFPALFQPHVYAIGGVDEDSRPLCTVERFDPVKRAWEPVAPLLDSRESCAVAAARGFIYAMGGHTCSTQSCATAERFSLLAGTWEHIPSMHRARSAATAVTLRGQVYAIGGRDGFYSLNGVERFDAVRHSWEIRPALPSPRFGAAATVLRDRAYLLGGRGDGLVLDTVEAFNLRMNQWEACPPMHGRRYRGAAAAAFGRVYVAGGCDGLHQGCLSSVECFNPELRIWSILAPLQVPRWGAAAVLAGGGICMLGGKTENDALSSVERLNIASGLWEPLPDMLKARRFLGSVACRS